AGSAAGDGSAYNGVYKGMAPQADLIVVKGGDLTFSTRNIINGIDYCRREAGERSRPVVINLSLGGQLGPHDGTSPAEVLIDQVSQNAGQAVAVAAGNSGTSPIHVGGTVAASETLDVEINVPEGYTPQSGAQNDVVVLDGWFGSNPYAGDGEGLTVSLVSPPAHDSTDARSRAALDTLGTTNGVSDTSGTIFLANEVPGNLGDGDLRTTVQLFDADATKPPAAGTWTLSIANDEGIPLRFDGWLYLRTPSLAEASLAQGNTAQTLGMPATAESAVTVGSFSSRAGWPADDGNSYSFRSIVEGSIAATSSRGPTRDGRTKPEITAPGDVVVSAKSADTGTDPNSPLVAIGGQHSVKSGTSMASPHVAGALALLLAEFPEKSASELKTLLQETATQDEFTGTSENNTYGAGTLNVFRAMIEEKGGSQAQRDRYAYYGDLSGFLNLTDDTKFGLQFTPDESGLLSEIEMETSVQGGSNNLAGVKGDGDLLYALYADDGNGLPGERLTDTLRKGLAEITPSTDEYLSTFDAESENLRVQAGQNYHVVLFPESPDDTLQILASDQRANASQPRSSVQASNGSTWQESTDAYGTDLEFAVAPVVVRSEDVKQLPVELAHFTTTPEGQSTLLRWRTLNETNNDHFEVRRRVDGAFETIRAVPSNVEGGTTGEPQSYSARVADLPPGRHRFQLRQVDADGTPTVLGVQAVQIGVAGSHELSGAYPNPFRRRARFDLSVAEGQDVRVAVYDALGRRVETLHDGELTPQKQHTFTVGADGLSSGLYFVRVNGEDFSDHVSVTLVR
ncbi:MAG: hypothetical protein BRD40_04175, partial [Bacteroidetes bacterium QS_1_65_9]